MKNILFESATTRFKGLLDNVNFPDLLETKGTSSPYDDPIFILAAILDPSCLLSFVPVSANYERYREVAMKLIIEQLPCVLVSPNPTNSHFESPQRLSTPSSSNSKSAVISFLEKRRRLQERPAQRARPISTATHEVETFFNLIESEDLSTFTFVSFWKENRFRFPLLAMLARKIMSVGVSSAGAERMFSMSGYLISSRRSRLKPETVERSMMFKGNRHLTM